MSRWRPLGILLAFALVVAAPAAQPRPGPAPILILVSFDGWRWDYINRFPATNLKALAARGVRATALISSFPSLTFPNHYTIVTGLYPAHHGIVANVMTDPWIPERFTMSAETAKDPRMVGRRADLGDGHPSGPARRDDVLAGIGGGDRPRATDVLGAVQQGAEESRPRRAGADVARAPRAERPSFVSLYFDEVDSAGHEHGPDSPELRAAALRLDAALGQLVAGVRNLGLEDRTTFVVVSDHGMTPLSYNRLIYLDTLIDLDTVDVLEWNGLLELTPRDGDVEALYRRLHGKHPSLAIYKRDQLPARLHYHDNPRIPAIIGIPDDGWAVVSSERLAERELSAGAHGYDPADRSMGALFVAAGPTLRRGLVVKPFENIHIYDLLCAVLKLAPAPNDGDPAVTRAFLR